MVLILICGEQYEQGEQTFEMLIRKIWRKNMISMTRQQQGDFNRCCDFLARMIEKYGDSIELGTVQKVVLIYEWINASGDKQDYILNLEYSRVA